LPPSYAPKLRKKRKFAALGGGKRPLSWFIGSLFDLRAN
jgi:hypothetical protein